MHGSILIAIFVIVLFVCCYYLYNQYAIHTSTYQEGAKFNIRKFFSRPKKSKPKPPPPPAIAPPPPPAIATAPPPPPAPAPAPSSQSAFLATALVGNQVANASNPVSNIVNDIDNSASIKAAAQLAEKQAQEQKARDDAAAAAAKAETERLAREAETKRLADEANRIAEENRKKELEKQRIANRSAFYNQNEKSVVKLLGNKLKVDLTNKNTDTSIQTMYNAYTMLFYGKINTGKTEEDIDVEMVKYINEIWSPIENIDTFGNKTERVIISLNSLNAILKQSNAKYTDYNSRVVLVKNIINVLKKFKNEFQSTTGMVHVVVNSMVSLMKNLGVDTPNELNVFLSFIRNINVTRFSPSTSAVSELSLTTLLEQLKSYGLQIKIIRDIHILKTIQNFGYTESNHASVMSTFSSMGLNENTSSNDILESLTKMGVRYNTFDDFINKTFQSTTKKYDIKNLKGACDLLMGFGVYYSRNNFKPDNYDKFMKTVIIPIIDHVKTNQNDFNKLNCWIIQGDLSNALTAFNTNKSLSLNSISVIIANLEAIGIPNLAEYNKLINSLSTLFFMPTIKPYFFNNITREFYRMKGKEFDRNTYSGYYNRIKYFINNSDMPPAAKPTDVDVYENYVKNLKMSYSQVVKTLGSNPNVNTISDSISSKQIDDANKSTKQGFTGSMLSDWGTWFKTLLPTESTHEGLSNIQLQETPYNLTDLLNSFGITNGMNIQKQDDNGKKIKINVQQFLSDINSTGATDLNSIGIYVYSLKNIEVSIKEYYTYVQILKEFQVPLNEFLTITKQLNDLKLKYRDIIEFFKCLIDLGVSYSTFTLFLTELNKCGVKFDKTIAVDNLTNKDIAFGFLKYMFQIGLVYNKPNSSVFDASNNPFVNSIMKMKQLVEYMEPQRNNGLLIDEIYGIRNRQLPVPLTTIINTCFAIDPQLRDFSNYNPLMPRKSLNDPVKPSYGFHLINSHKFLPETLVTQQKIFVQNTWDAKIRSYISQISAKTDYNNFLKKVKIVNPVQAVLTKKFELPLDLDVFQACMTTKQFDTATQEQKLTIHALLGRFQKRQVMDDGALQLGILETFEKLLKGLATPEKIEQYKSKLFSFNLCVLFPFTSLKYVSDNVFANNSDAVKKREYYQRELRCERNLYAPMSNADRTRCQASNKTDGFTGYQLSNYQNAYRNLEYSNTVLPVQIKQNSGSNATGSSSFSTYNGKRQYTPYTL